MKLRTRRRDAITDMPVPAHRGIVLNGHFYDITTVMHLCYETCPKDLMTQTPLSAADRERIRALCAQIGMTPKRRASRRVDDMDDGDAVEFHIDSVLDAIQHDMLWVGSVPVEYLDRLAGLLCSLRKRKLARGQYLTDIVMQQLKHATNAHDGGDGVDETGQNAPHPILAYLEARL